MKIKVVYGNDIHRWRYPRDNRYSDLIAFVKRAFRFQNEKEFQVQFEDDEGDRLTISSESDFNDAFSCAEQDGRRSLKIFVKCALQRQVSESQSVKSMDFDLVSAPSENSEGSHVMVDIEAEQAQEEQKEELCCAEEVEECCEEMEEEQVPCDKAKCRQLMLDFLTDENIRNVLPELARQLVKSLREWVNSKNENVISFEEVVREVLKDEKFVPIVGHELFEKKISPRLSCLLARVQQYRHVLLNFNADAVGAWIPHIINVLTSALADFNAGSFDVGMDPMCHAFFPTWFAFMNAHGDVNDSAESIHRRITCDECNVSPIRGPRFKCTVCADYDLCARCESFGKHDPSHPMMKMYRPVGWYHPPHYFGGLHEIIGRWLRSGSQNSYPTPTPFGWGGGGYQHGQNQGGGRCRRDRRQWCGNGGRFNRWNRCGGNGNQQSYNPKFAPRPNLRDHGSGSVSESAKRRVAAEFVRDVNLPDRSEYPCETIMKKCWEMKNTGDGPWGNDVQLVFLKGNKSLSMEESYPVPNAQSGETVQVCAMIRTPKDAGRYCTYYRLARNGEKFGPRVWVDIFAVEPKKVVENEAVAAPQAAPAPQMSKADKKALKKQEKELKRNARAEQKRMKLQRKLQKVEAELEKLNSIKEDQKPPKAPEKVQEVAKAEKPKEVVPSKADEKAKKDAWALSCMCGQPLVQTTPIIAYYPGASVNCDICGKYCPSSAKIYHCPSKATAEHPEGYDLCRNCVDFQMKSFKKAQEEEKAQAPPKAPAAPVEPKPEAQPQPKPEPKPEAKPVVKVEEPPKPEAEPEPVEIPEEAEVDPLKDFVYAVQARRIVDMGFRDVEQVKFLLTKHNGNVDRVVQALIG